MESTWLHFDGKLVKEISEELNVSVTFEIIAVSVTTPYLEDRADFLLGIVQSESS